MKNAGTWLTVVGSAAVLCSSNTYAQNAGPPDWLDAGVRVPQADDLNRLFGFTEDSSLLDRLVPLVQSDGVILLSRREFFVAEDDTLASVDVPIGYFFPESFVDDKKSALLNREIDFHDVLASVADEMDSAECEPFLCAQLECLAGTSSIEGRGVAGQYVSFEGETQFVIGRTLSIEFDAEDPEYTTTDPVRTFATDFIAERSTISQDVLAIGTWLTTRQRAAEGCWLPYASEKAKHSDEEEKICAAILRGFYDDDYTITPSMIDDVFRPYDPAEIEELFPRGPDGRVWVPLPTGPAVLPSGYGCHDDWIECMKEKVREYRRENERIRATTGERQKVWEMAWWCGVGGAGVGATIGAVCTAKLGPGAAIGAIAGGIIGFGGGGCGGYLLGECVLYGGLEERLLEKNMEAYICAQTGCFNDYLICKATNKGERE